MSALYIIGSGGHSRPIISTVNLLGSWDLRGVIDINFKNKDEKVLGVKVLGSLEVLNEIDKKSSYVFLAIGDNRIRRHLFSDPLVSSFKTLNIVHPNAFFDNSAETSLGNFIGPFAHIGPEVKIGKSNIINSYVNIEHESSLKDFNHIAPGAIICGRCQIGSEVFIGSNATVVENTSIADRNIIGAGSIIIESILKKDGKYVGNPGKLLERG